MVDVAGVAPARAAGGRALPRGAWVVAGLAVALLAAFGGGYGYHRDELYFLEAGRHPAFGYPDQPPLVPLLAVAADVLGGGHLWVLRLVPALLVGATVVLAALTSRELGGARATRSGRRRPWPSARRSSARGTCSRRRRSTSR